MDMHKGEAIVSFFKLAASTVTAGAVSTPVVEVFNSYVNLPVWGVPVSVIGAAAFAADPKMLASLVSWVAFAFIAAAVTIFVSRIGFPSIQFKDLLEAVRHEKNTAAAIVVASVVLYCALTFVGVVLWAK